MKKNILLIVIMMAITNVSFANWFGIGLGSYTLTDNTENYTWKPQSSNADANTISSNSHTLDTSKDPSSGFGLRISYGIDWLDSTSIEFVLHLISKSVELQDCTSLLGSACSVNLNTSLNTIGAIAVQSFQLGGSSGIFFGGGVGYSTYTKKLVIEAQGYESEDLQEDSVSKVSGILRVGAYFAENWEVSIDYIGPYGDDNQTGSGSSIGLGVNYNFYN